MAPTLVVAAVALVLVLATLTVCEAQSKVRIFGDRFRHPQSSEDFVRTYVDMPQDHDGNTLPLAVGLQFTPGFIRLADVLPFNSVAAIKFNATMAAFNYTAYDHYVMHFPQVGKVPFKFSSWTYNLFGHPAIGVYDYQHFDIRFFFEDPDTWWNEYFSPNNHGPCNGASADLFYKTTEPIPLKCWPGNVDEVSSDRGNFVWGQGVHLYNRMEEQWTNPAFNDVQSVVWGMMEGELSFMESMISRARAGDADFNKCVDLSSVLPEYFATERAVPSELCWTHGSATFKVEMRKFVMRPGGCNKMRDGPMTGYYPPERLELFKSFGHYAPECHVYEP